MDIVLFSFIVQPVAERTNHMSAPKNVPSTTLPASDAIWLETVRNYVGSIKFGVVQIVVHDSAVVQIERTEKLRLDRRKPETN